MRLLTEDMPVPAINIKALRGRLLKQEPAVETEKPLNLEAEPVENRNLNLARQVEKYKAQLIQHLSSFPVTAMWLMDKYDLSCPSVEGEEESAALSGLDDFLKPLKTNFQSLQAQLANPDNDTSAVNKIKLHLKQAIVEFPLAFEDLKTIVDLMIEMASGRDGTEEWCSNIDVKQGDIVRKRIRAFYEANGNRRNAKNFHNKQLSQHYEPRLVISDEVSEDVLHEIILAEHHWLFYRQQLAIVNAKLVLFIANQYKGSFLDFEDLVQEGQSGLLKAVDRFKHQLGYQFSTYAGYWIRQAISRALSRSERVVRIPCGQVATINRVYKTKEELLQKTGKEPKIEDIAQRLNITEEEVNNILLISQSSVSLEAFDDDEDENSFAPIDFVEQQVFSHSSEMIADDQLQGLVDAAIKTLNPREARIINSHFGMGSGDQKTLQQIGAELNLTRERVRQIQVVALNKIKMRYGEQLLSFL